MADLDNQDATLEINSTGGLLCGELYLLVQAIRDKNNLTVVAIKTHSAAALLFLAGKKRIAYQDGEVVLKTPSVEIKLFRLSQLSQSDLDGYLRIYNQFRATTEELVSNNTKIDSVSIREMFERDGAIILLEKDLLKSGVAHSFVT